jgi:hypothetical protein
MRKYCTSKNEVPTIPHWAIITFSSICIPGDERSRTAPGHGYPEHYESTASYCAYTDETEWSKEVKRMSLEKNPENFVAVYVAPATITTKVEVGIHPSKMKGAFNV